MPGGALLTSPPLPTHPPSSSYSPPSSTPIFWQYLDPNKILVLVGLPDGAPRSAAPAGRPRLTALVLDGVSGRVLASAVHKDARGPAHAVLSENLAAYHYLSLSASRWQASARGWGVFFHPSSFWGLERGV